MLLSHDCYSFTVGKRGVLTALHPPLRRKNINTQVGAARNIQYVLLFGTVVPPVILHNT